MLCFDGQVQLRGGSSGNDANGYYYTEGLVDVCINETYGAVCGDDWSGNAAAVVCRNLGYFAPYYGMYALTAYNCLLLTACRLLFSHHKSTLIKLT